jgi:hypothetical protein
MLGRKDVICMKDDQGKIQTHTQWYLVLIAFPRRQWICESASVLRYTFIICRVFEIAAAAAIYNTG